MNNAWWSWPTSQLADFNTAWLAMQVFLPRQPPSSFSPPYPLFHWEDIPKVLLFPSSSWATGPRTPQSHPVEAQPSGWRLPFCLENPPGTPSNQACICLLWSWSPPAPQAWHSTSQASARCCWCSSWWCLPKWWVSPWPPPSSFSAWLSCWRWQAALHWFWQRTKILMGFAAQPGQNDLLALPLHARLAVWTFSRVISFLIILMFSTLDNAFCLFGVIFVSMSRVWIGFIMHGLCCCSFISNFPAPSAPSDMVVPFSSFPACSIPLPSCVACACISHVPWTPDHPSSSLSWRWPMSNHVFLPPPLPDPCQHHFGLPSTVGKRQPQHCLRLLAILQLSLLMRWQGILPCICLHLQLKNRGSRGWRKLAFFPCRWDLLDALSLPQFGPRKASRVMTLFAQSWAPCRRSLTFTFESCLSHLNCLGFGGLLL